MKNQEPRTQNPASSARRPRTMAPVILLLLFITSISTGALLLTNGKPSTKNKEPGTSSLYILGPARKLLSAGLYERADVYFHRGAPRHQDEAFESIYQKWKKQITPGLHAHAHGNQVQEILPWLRLASQSDPHNVELFLVASFWLSGECGRPDLAHKAIGEALINNPKNYELYQERCRLFLSTDDHSNALKALETAYELILKGSTQDEEQVAIDQPAILMKLSYLYEAENRLSDAIEATKNYLKIQNTPLAQERLRTLEQGKTDPEAAKARLHQLFYKEHQCEREDHDHDDHIHGPECNH